MQAAYLFNYSTKPWLTQKWANEIMDNYYGDDPIGGWKGDEDQGQMGAWYVMSAMGLFQMDGGASVNPIYEIGSPQFKKVIINLDPTYYKGGIFSIEAKNVSDVNIYVQSATLNGKPLNKTWFYHHELINGGSLILEMGATPNKNWGSNIEDVPPSMSTVLSQEEINEIMHYDKLGEELEEWNRAIKAYYYHKKEHFEFLPNTKNEIIFLGNSISDSAEWAELFQNPNIKNRGIGGDDTDGILDRLTEVTESNPYKVFIMIGTNDLAYGKSVEYVIENHKKIVTQIKKNSPKTKIFIQSILPVDEVLHPTRPNASIKKINKALKEISDNENLIYIDLASEFDDENGKLDEKYSIDGLHINGLGYQKWMEIIEQHISQ
jgi:lysophospholipase L1-like esterase